MTRETEQQKTKGPQSGVTEGGSPGGPDGGISQEAVNPEGGADVANDIVNRVPSESEVVEYLRSHPEFFVDHDYLLKEIRVPHLTGSAISLVERQVHVFREQRDQLRQEMAELISIARENDRFFERSKRLLLNLLESKSLEEVSIILDDSIRNDFKLDQVSLLLFGSEKDYPASNLQLIELDKIHEVLGHVLESSRAICGRLQPAHYEILFPQAQSKVGSAAVIPLRHGELLGTFSIGSKDQNYFDKGMGSLFLSYISDTLSRILPPLLAQERVNPVADVVSVSS
ncbi:MAG: hypothetical protein CSA52_02860 [Gammaproteobacteria bacterium]|nr:MAG: hypothetical protein CSB48_04530 [Pseudomonadota bacterium]PIE38339.1 MAG: hypothetical protein CSA52_02860 [Gammaproteobacteria bacterium]